MSEKIPISDDEPRSRQLVIERAMRQLLMAEHEVENIAGRARSLNEARESVIDRRIEMLHQIMDKVDQSKHDRQKFLEFQVEVGIVLAKMDKADAIAKADVTEKEVDSDRRILDWEATVYEQEKIIAEQRRKSDEFSAESLEEAEE